MFGCGQEHKDVLRENPLSHLSDVTPKNKTCQLLLHLDSNQDKKLNVTPVSCVVANDKGSIELKASLPIMKGRFSNKLVIKPYMWLESWAEIIESWAIVRDNEPHKDNWRSFKISGFRDHEKISHKRKDVWDLEFFVSFFLILLFIKVGLYLDFSLLLFFILVS